MSELEQLLNQYNRPTSNVTFIDEDHRSDNRQQIRLIADFDFSRMEDVNGILGESELIQYIKNGLLAQTDKILKLFKEQLT